MTKVIFVVIIVAVLGGLGIMFKPGDKAPRQPGESNQYPQSLQNQPPQQQSSSGGYGMKKPFYQKGGVSLQHYWPDEGSFSNEETEILLFNDSNSNLQVTSFDLVYTVESKVYPHKSGTWEKFPSRQSWDRIEYININKPHYQGQSLDLARGQKGKLHWHIQFGPNPLDGKQTVKVKLALLKGNETITIDEQFNRASGVVVSKDNH